MKRSALIALLLSVMLLVSGCAASASKNASLYEGEQLYAYDAPADAAPQAAPAPESYSIGRSADTSAAADRAGDTKPADASTRKIVYRANMGLTADDPSAALDTIMQKAEALGGYIGSSYVSNDDYGAYYASATLKVPAPKLAELVSAAEESATVDSYNLNSDDISLSYYDIQARLKSAKAEEEQLLEILSRCENVEDLLAVREHLASVRADIESYQGQINLWDNLVDYATLELSIRRTERSVVEGEKSLIKIWKGSDVWNKISRGFQNSARFVVNALGAIGIFLAYALIPGAILFCCIGIPIIISARRKKKKRIAIANAQAAAAEEKAAETTETASTDADATAAEVTEATTTAPAIEEPATKKTRRKAKK